MEENHKAKHPGIRKSPRATFHDYSGGDYFVTICTADKRHYFGEIHNGEICLSSIGVCCQQQLENVSTHYPYASVPSFVVMPNHIHAIICVESNCVHGKQDVGTHGSCVQSERRACGPIYRSALSVVVGGIKREVTLFARRHNLDFAWQDRYYDHIIRGSHDGNNIADYIQNNVARWEMDCFNDELGVDIRLTK